MIKIKTALISVYDKSGILELAQKLFDNNVEIISSGGTSKYLKENNIKVTEVEDYTGFSEIFDASFLDCNSLIPSRLILL